MLTLAVFFIYLYITFVPLIATVDLSVSRIDFISSMAAIALYVSESDRNASLHILRKLAAVFRDNKSRS